jgi:L-seryl-tRNA(Ser) seleniumtransferase
MMQKPDFSLIPKVDGVLDDVAMQPIRVLCDGPLLTDLVREAIDVLRNAMKEGQCIADSREVLTAWVIQTVQDKLTQRLSPNLKRVINGTGIILHTNLGRAPLPDEAIAQIVAVAGRYSNVEIDLDSGLRGSRTSLVEDLLCQLTGAEAAAVVNNNAAAVLLALNTLALGKEAIVSRGELVEIGGSFRIPDIMSRSGAIMVEVGTTNRTHLKDFESAVTEETGAMLVVHTSNYKVMGFTAAVELEDLVALGKDKGIATIHDLGGGVLVDLRDYGLPYEPLVSDSVQAGVDVVTFSGDKVLGGPQCGILVGKKEAIEQVRKNPLMRALRCDKLTYAALEATLKLFLNPSQLQKSHPTLRMLTESVSVLKRRGRQLVKQLASVNGIQVELVDSVAQTGSGALPLEEIPSVAVAIACEGVDHLATKLRKNDPPIVGYVREDRLLLDMRTLWPDDLKAIIIAVGNVIKAD